MMRFLTTIILGMSSLTLAYPDAGKFQALFRPHLAHSASQDTVDSFLYSRDMNVVNREALLWRRSGQSPPSSSRPVGPQSRVAFSGSTLKGSSKSAIADPSRQQRSQPGPSRPSAGVFFAQSGKESDCPSNSANPAQAQGKPRLPRSPQLGMGKNRGGARSRSASSGRSDYPGYQEIESVNKPTHVEELRNRPILQATHGLMMQHASAGIEAANERSVTRVSEGKREPDRPADKYRALKDAKVETRRAHRDANQKIKAAGQALRRGSAMDAVTKQNFDLADEAVRKADRTASNFQGAHVEAAASAVEQGRWSDYADHIKKDVKTVSRINASKAYLGAMKAKQQDKHNIEQLSKIDRSDPRREAAVDRAINSRVESKAAKQFSAFQYRLYQDSRQRFADSSSSEDEMEL